MRCPPGTAPGSMSRPGLAQAAYRTMVGPQGPHRGYSRSHGRPACHRPHYRPHAVMVLTPLRDAVWSWRASSSLSVAVSCHALGCPTVTGPWDNLKHRAACRHDGIGTHGRGCHCTACHVRLASGARRAVFFPEYLNPSRGVDHRVPAGKKWMAVGTYGHTHVGNRRAGMHRGPTGACDIRFFIEPPLMAAYSAWCVCYAAAATRARSISVKTCLGTTHIV